MNRLPAIGQRAARFRNSDFKFRIEATEEARGIVLRASFFGGVSRSTSRLFRQGALMAANAAATPPDRPARTPQRVKAKVKHATQTAEEMI